MNNLEEAYRKSIQEETPDLWNRIASALPEKPSSAQKPKKIYQYTHFMKAAAAVLVMAMILPGAWFLISNGNNMAKNESAAMDTADAGAIPREASEESLMLTGMDGGTATDSVGVAEPAVGTTSNENPEEGIVCESAPAADAAKDTDSAGQMVYEYEEMKENLAETETTGCAEHENASQNVQAETESKMQISGEMTVVRIVCQDSDRQESAETVYQLRTAEGELVEAIPAPDLTVTLTEGNTYRFTLQEVSGEVRTYCIVSVEEVKPD